MTNNILDEINYRLYRYKADNMLSDNIVIYYGYSQRDAILAALKDHFMVEKFEQGVLTHLFGCRCLFVPEEDHLNIGRIL